MKMTHELAKTMLYLPLDQVATVQAVKRAFTQCSKELHPDSPAYSSARILGWIEDLKAARDYLLSELKAAAALCTMCEGRGKVRARMGWRPCGACNGTGDKKP